MSSNVISQENVLSEINTILGGESKEFIVKAKRKFPLKTSLPSLIFGLIWLTVVLGILFFAFLGPLFSGGEIHFKLNGVPTVAGPDNLKPLLVPVSVMGIFVLVGLGMAGYGIYALFAKGPWYIGTVNRLVIYEKNNLRSIDWEQFSGDIRVSGSNDKGNISLQMRTGRMVHRKNRPAEYVPDVIYICGIPDAFAVEQVCRKRIKENDPTPANTLE